MYFEGKQFNSNNMSSAGMKKDQEGASPTLTGIST